MEKTHKGVNYHFFLDGPLSNWYRVYFNIDGVDFNCVEQYMMYMKAKTFSDETSAQNILKEKSPRWQKQLGRGVSNFNPTVWDKVKIDIVKKACLYKFSVDKELKNYLKTLKGLKIVEASPWDRVWGIGYSEEDAIENLENWGENLLGNILTDIANGKSI